MRLPASAALAALLASCAPAVTHNPDFPIQIGEVWEVSARGQTHAFSLERQTSSPQAAQLKFFIYVGANAEGNTVEASALINTVLAVRVFSRPGLSEAQRFSEPALVCRATSRDGRWRGSSFVGTALQEGSGLRPGTPPSPTARSGGFAEPRHPPRRLAAYRA